MWEIVIGKYLAVCAFFSLMLSSTIIYLIIMLATGNPNMGPVTSWRP